MEGMRIQKVSVIVFMIEIKAGVVLHAFVSSSCDRRLQNSLSVANKINGSRMKQNTLSTRRKKGVSNVFLSKKTDNDMMFLFVRGIGTS